MLAGLSHGRRYRMRSLKSACVLALVLLSMAAPLRAQEETAPPPSSDSRIHQGRTLVEGGSFTEALSILRPLALDQPDDSPQLDVLFLVGLAALGAAEHPETPKAERKDYLNEAIDAFHRILVVQPELVRVRLELARAFYVKGDDRLSRKEFERVLAEDLPPPVVANIRTFLASIRQRRRWSGYFGMAMAPDTNITGSATDEKVYIPDLLFGSGQLLAADYNPDLRSGLGIRVWGGGEYEHPLSPKMRLRAGGGVSRTEYEGRDFDSTFLFAHGGPRWLASARTDMSLLASARRSWSGGEPQYRDLGARFELSHFLSRRVLVRTQASRHQRSYDEDVHLDGPRSDFSLTGLWQATPIMRLEATVGLSREHTESELWRNGGQSVDLGTSIDLPRGFTVGLNGGYRWTNYDGRGSVLPLLASEDSRRDRTQTLGISLYNRGFTIQGFSPKLMVTRETRESNAQLRDYEKTRVELQFVRLL